MAQPIQQPRVLILPSQGLLMVTTDLHGNLDDYAALEQRFRSHPKGAIHWAIFPRNSDS